MGLEDVLLVFHIAAAGTWLGANLVQAIVPPLAAKEGPATEAGWYRIAARLSRSLYMPVSIVILVTGVWMVLIDDAYGFTNAFVNIGFAMIVVGAVLGILVFDPGSRNAAEAIVSGDAEAMRVTRFRIAAFGVLDTLLILFTMTAMVLRLGS
ncbi:MAG: DUF2269 family protein [Acidimicrobiia bacterium]